MSPCRTPRSERKTRDRTWAWATLDRTGRHRTELGVDMQVGVVFPQNEIGADASAVRAYGEHVEGLGFTRLRVYDQVVGADPKIHIDWEAAGCSGFANYCCTSSLQR
jgi:hypothetical protein